MAEGHAEVVGLVDAVGDDRFADGEDGGLAAQAGDVGTAAALGFATREAIVAVHLRDRPLADDVDFRLLARETEGRSGADIAGLCRQATVLAIREAITADRIDEADDLRVALRHVAEAAGQLSYDYFDDSPYAPPVEQPQRRSWWG